MLRSPDENPRTVSRGLEIQSLFLGIDSLYLVVEYPHIDVYKKWSSGIESLGDRRLFEGIPHDDMIIRRGALGYKLSVWSGDARLFITDRVNDELQETPSEGQGMGVMLQLGPKWLQVYGDFTSYEALYPSLFALLEQFGVKNPEKYPIRINRIDVALDVAGLSMEEISIDEWRSGWVGRASSKHFYDDARTGKLSGFAIGSSKGAIRFKAYDKILEATKGNDFGFWYSVWNTEELASVTRFEWTIKPHDAKFIGMQFLSDYSFDGLKELLNYVTQKWGRLCLSQPDKNPSRREIHPLWVRLRRIIIEEWDIDHVGCAKREYHLTPDLNYSYLNSVTGWIGGLMARVGVLMNYDRPADLDEALRVAQTSSKTIEEKATHKWDVISKLSGKNDNG